MRACVPGKDPEMTGRFLRMLCVLPMLLAIVATSSLPALAQTTPAGNPPAYQPPPELNGPDDPAVAPAEYFIGSDGEVGSYQLFDSPEEGAGTICLISSFGKQPYVLVSPVQVLPAQANRARESASTRWSGSSSRAERIRSTTGDISRGQPIHQPGTSGCRNRAWDSTYSLVSKAQSSPE